MQKMIEAPNPVDTRLRLGRGLQKRLGVRLTEDGILTEDQLSQALARQTKSGEFLGEALIGLGFITPQQIGPYMEEVTGFPFFDLAEQRIDEEVAQIMTESTCLSRRVVPFRIVKGRVHVAMADPLNLGIVDKIRSMIDQPLVPYLAFPGDVDEAIRRAFGGKTKAQAALEEIRDESEKSSASETIEQLIGMAEDAPIVRLVHSIVTGAVSAGASDVHLEPQEDSIRVRYRIDGLLYEQMNLPAHVLAATMSRLKIMSNLDIAEKRRPQDGRFAMREDSGREFDVRISLMPTVYGEKACMRILEKRNKGGNLDRLGLLPHQQQLFEKLIKRPHGILLVTGPTGSGKSTTLYAALASINEPGININKVEDPVEYKLAGINQMQVNPRIGVTFAAGLRTLVRQDPDVILVGEIRDGDTAGISIQAALTGHLVLSTLHTNDAPGALVRLQNMGVEPFLISSAVIGVIGQRLLRTTCSGCKEEQPLGPELIKTLGLEPGHDYRISRGTGCRRCGGRGTVGRTAVYELMRMTDNLRHAVLKGESGDALYDMAVREGMKTMRQTALRKMLDHIVSPEEVLRVLSYQE
jgi:type IV pilus assembly protein PilB